MSHYIGIDLGTTNSAICSFDGRETRIWKSPEQSDVTPSAIYIDRRGHRFFGRKAFELASANEKNAATLFKRYMGTEKIFALEDSGVSLTPVECSAMLLKVLFGYLPEEIRNDPETAVVITVPAAFNQMKKDATLEAARLAGIGKTALMQEPVAAVMSVLKKDDREKRFIIYDLGGGTFDVSVARFVGGHVSLLAQGGREMLGGRDMDRWIYARVILPWLREHFHLPQDPDEDEKYRKMKRSILFAAEEAKIALSSMEETQIWMDEDAVGTGDEDGKEIFLDLTLTREDLAPLIEEVASESAELTREAMQRAGTGAAGIDQIVFVGGPTMYAPLREAVCRQLGIARGTAVNPMTAVSEGAAIYAETINWENDQHRKKESIDEQKDEKTVTIRYEKRTSLPVGKIAVIFPDDAPRTVVLEPCREDDGNSKPGGSGSGLEDAQDEEKITKSIVRQGILDVPLPGPGTYVFTMRFLDSAGKEALEQRRVEMTRVLASVESIPASHSIAVKALDRPGGAAVPVYLVEINDPLPKSGTVTFHSAVRLVAGSSGTLTFSLWEGEIRDPIEDNRYIGTFRIPGTAFSGGVVAVGAEVICDYEMNEAGNLRLGVVIPSVGLRMEGKNFYSRYEGQLNLQDTYALVKETNQLLERTSQMKLRIVDGQLDEVRKTLLEIRQVFSSGKDPEGIAQAESRLQECYKKVALLHIRYASVIRSHDLDRVIETFETVRKDATQDEIAEFQNLVEGARYSIDLGSSDFDGQIQELKRLIAQVRWHQDSYVRKLFMAVITWPGDFTDRSAFERLRAAGLTCLENGQMDRLREIINELGSLMKSGSGKDAEHMLDEVGIYV